MQYSLRISDLAGGDDTGRLPTGFFVAVADEAVETKVKSIRAQYTESKVVKELTSTAPKAP